MLNPSPLNQRIRSEICDPELLCGGPLSWTNATALFLLSSDWNPNIKPFKAWAGFQLTSVKYLEPQGHLKNFPSLMVVSSLYKASHKFPLVHTELLRALLAVMRVCCTGKDRTGNTVLALNCTYRNS